MCSKHIWLCSCVRVCVCVQGHSVEFWMGLVWQDDWSQMLTFGLARLLEAAITSVICQCPWVNSFVYLMMNNFINSFKVHTHTHTSWCFMIPTTATKTILAMIASVIGQFYPGKPNTSTLDVWCSWASGSEIYQEEKPYWICSCRNVEGLHKN